MPEVQEIEIKSDVVNLFFDDFSIQLPYSEFKEVMKGYADTVIVPDSIKSGRSDESDWSKPSEQGGGYSSNGFGEQSIR